MRNLFKNKLVVTFTLCFFGVIIIFCAAFLLNGGTLPVFTSSNDDCDVKSLLLLQAIDEVGSCNPEAAARTWASGLEKRSAALQYVVMSKELKGKYFGQLKKASPNWVTGVSSQWVNSYEITSVEHMGDKTSIFTLKFLLATSTGPAGEYSAVLTIEKQGDYWRIVKISADEQLYPYTLFSN